MFRTKNMIHSDKNTMNPVVCWSHSLKWPKKMYLYIIHNIYKDCNSNASFANVTQARHSQRGY